MVAGQVTVVQRLYYRYFTVRSPYPSICYVALYDHHHDFVLLRWTTPKITIMTKSLTCSTNLTSFYAVSASRS
jgi:hypothetical protein